MPLTANYRGDPRPARTQRLEPRAKMPETLPMTTSSGVRNIVRAKLAGLAAQGQAISSVVHNGVKGRLRELVVQQLIRPFLPPRIVPMTGAIVTQVQRTERNEDDIVLFDKDRAPLLWDDERTALMPIEGVRAHVEVKSTLTAGDVRAAVRAAAELIRHQPEAEAPMGLLFAFDTDLEVGSSKYPDGDGSRLRDIVRDNWTPSSGQCTSPIQLLCIAGRGTWILTRRQNDEGWFFVPARDDQELLAFASVISNACYGNGLGAGRHLLEPSWLSGPNPPAPMIQP